VTAARLQITSPANPRVKDALKLRRRSHRDKLQRTLVEGRTELHRALESRHALDCLFTCETLFPGAGEAELADRCAAAGIETVDCTEQVFRKLSYRDSPDGLLAVAAQVRHGIEALVLSPTPLLLVAESIEKPGNLGTMLRCADAAGADGVIVCDRRTDLNNPNVIRASLGTLFCVTTAEAAGAEAVEWLRARGIAIVAAAPAAETVYTAADLRGPVAVVVGAEHAGLSATWLEAADTQVRIPMLGRADSLNVSQSAALLLFEAVRQRAG
jgi:TrmH family RNA methyltransferase